MQNNLKEAFLNLSPAIKTILEKDKLKPAERVQLVTIPAQKLKDFYDLMPLVLDCTLWLLHIPKTGGSSVKSFLQKNRLPNVNFEYNTHKRFTFSENSKLLNESKKLIKSIILRCPIGHTKSMYSFSKQGGGALWEVNECDSFSEWIRSGAVDNFYTKWLCNKEEHSSSKAIETLEDFDVVLDTNDLDSGMERLLELVGANLEFDNRHTNKSDSGFEISDEDIEYIKKARSEDYEITRKFNIKELY